MKVLFPNLYQNISHRGGERFVEELLENLPPSIITKVLSGNNAIINQTDPTSLLSKSFLTRKRLLELVFTLKSLKQIIREKPDILFPLNGAWQSLICKIYCSLMGAKLVIAGQSGPGWDDRWNLFLKPDIFVALTAHQKIWAQKATIWKQKIILIPNGVDTSKFTPRGSKLRLGLSHPIIICVGASSKSKRVIETIKAVSQTKASLLLVGRGELDEDVDQLGKTLLGNRFLHKNIPPEKMPAAYRTCDLFTLVSDSSEAFGIAYIEALASGLGCVATNDASRREIIGNAGLFVDDLQTEYPKVLASALQENWHTKAILQASNFSSQNMATSYAKIFSKLVK